MTVLFILGDFNYCKVKLKTFILWWLKVKDSLRLSGTIFFIQKVHEPIRRDFILELILTNKSQNWKNVEVGENLANSNHKIICFVIIISVTVKENLMLILSFQRANFIGFVTVLIFNGFLAERF